MSMFLKWLLPIIVGVGVSMVGLFLVACAASYGNIWLAGFVLFLLFFGAVAGLYFTSDRNER